jgi:dTDP-4-amino-4,6-dideoxygalactose transaminase
MSQTINRRKFVAATAAAGVGLAMTGTSSAADKPALLGGTPVHTGGWPSWPEWRKAWEPQILEVLRSGQWYRGGGGGKVPEFEAAYAKLLGAKRCLATASGTTSLITALHVVGVDAGDEVICSPFTFIATYNAILAQKALPVFADTDPASMTIDPATIESRITDRTRAIVPVHIYGMPCDMDPINAIARRRGLAVVEDACQAWLAEYRGRKCGTLGDLGCFSFQNSKHIPAGEGGAITGNSNELIDRCFAYHNCGQPTGTFRGKGCFTPGVNYRMQHFQAAMLVQQIDKLVAETAVRRANADYLCEQLKEIPGIAPARLPEGGRAVWHLFPIHYDAHQFHGLQRHKFIAALNAEGVPAHGVYTEQYFDGLLDEAIASRGFRRLWPAERLKTYRESLHELKGNKQVCSTTIAVPQTVLLTDRRAIDQIIEAIRKVQAHSEALAKA